MNSLTTVGGTVVADDIDLGPLPPQSTRGGNISSGGKGSSSSSSRRAPHRLPPRSPTATSSSSKKPAFQRRDKSDTPAPPPSPLRSRRTMSGPPPPSSPARRNVSWGESSTKSTSNGTDHDDTRTIEVDDPDDGEGNAYNEDEFAPSMHRVGPVVGGVKQRRSTSLSPSSSSSTTSATTTTTTTPIMGKKKWTPPRPRSVPRRPSSLIDRRQSSAPSTPTSFSSTMADRPIINKWRHYSDGYANKGNKKDDDDGDEFDRWQHRRPHPASYSSQIPPPPPHSPSVTAFHDALRSTSVIETLISVANIEPYVSSPYFQRIFARGLSKLADGGGGGNGEVDVVEDDVEDAIRKSFGLHDDMVRVIAAAANGLMGGMTTTGNNATTSGNSAMISPTNTATLATARRRQDDNVVDDHRVRLQRLLSMDLSGYSNKELRATSNDNGNGDCDSSDDDNTNDGTNKRHLRCVSMPSSLRPQISSPSTSFTTVPIQLTPSPSTAAVANRVRPRPPRPNGGLSSRERTWSSRPTSLLLPPQSSSVSDDRFSGSRRPTSRQSTMVVEGGERPYHPSSPPSANGGGSFYLNAASTTLPSRDTTIDSARRYLGHTTRVEGMEDFLPSFLGGQQDEEIYDNESNSNNNNNNNNADDDITKTTTISTVVSKRMTDAEEIIRLTEQSLGLLSLQDYKLELARIIAARVEMETKFQSELDLAGHEIHTKDERIDQYRIIMEEAERAIASYEEAVHELEEASDEKDALIDQLSERVSELELELERVLGEKTTTDAERMTTIETLKANIVRMKSDAEVRDVDRSELHANITNLESKLDTVTKSYTASQAELTNAHGIIALRDERIRSSEQEVILMKEMLQGHIQLYQNEISLSLENATLVMDSLTNQKDSIIATLNDKIVLLEQSLTELEEEKEVYAMTNEKSSKELNEKIHTLAVALTEKDRLIELLQQQQQHNKTRKKRAVSTPSSKPDPETSATKMTRHNRQAYATYNNNERGGYGESKISSHYHSSPRQLIRQQGKTAKNERWHHQEEQRNHHHHHNRHHLTPEEYITTMESRDDDDFDNGQPLLPPRIIMRERSHPKSSHRLVAPVLYYTTDDDSIFT